MLLAIVDYDNMCADKDERTVSDVAFNLNCLRERLARHCEVHQIVAEEIRLRLYGGWLRESGQYSQRAQLILAAMKYARGKYKNIRFNPEIVTSLAHAPSLRLHGTYRLKNSKTKGPKHEQKMVDTMMVADAIYFSRFHRIAIVSDDDDVLPGLIAASHESQSRGYLIRRRAYGEAINDSASILNRIAIARLESTLC